MKIKVIVLSALFSFFCATVTGQEGHPFKGTWRGNVTMAGEQSSLVIIMDYSGNGITGMINPGRTSYNFNTAELDASSWTLTATATTRDGEDVSLEGTLHDIGARNRYIEGTWHQDGNSYPFRLTRE